MRKVIDLKTSDYSPDPKYGVEVGNCALDCYTSKKENGERIAKALDLLDKLENNDFDSFGDIYYWTSNYARNSS